MEKNRVTVVIPGCNEGFMQHTIDSLLTNAHGDVEIIAVIDGGPWPNPPLKADPRVIVLRHPEMQGMRQSFNQAAEIASGEFLMKCDAHTIFAPGWDAALKADCDGDWVVIPTRHSIDGIKWKGADNWRESLARDRSDERSCVLRRDYNYHYWTFPYGFSMYGYGIHGKTFSVSRTKEQPHVPSHNTRVNQMRAAYPIDDTMSFQGSCWFTTASHFKCMGPLDWEGFYFYAESVEIGGKTLALGGRCVVNKNTWYAHYHKGANNLHTSDGRVGRGFFLNVRRKRDSEAFATDYFLGDKVPGFKRTFVQIIEQFDWLMKEIPPEDRWPEDWTNPKYRVDFLNRPPEAIPAHI